MSEANATPSAPSADAAPAVITQRTWFGRTAFRFHELKQQVPAGASGAHLPVELRCAASRVMACVRPPRARARARPRSLPQPSTPTARPPFFTPSPCTRFSQPRSESYAYMFGAKGMVTGVLNKDVEENTGGLERAAAKLRASAPQGALSTPALVEELLALECVGASGGGGAAALRAADA